MIICLPTIGEKGMEEKVFNHFGSANYFTIYDTQSKNIKTVQNNNLHHEHGACQPLAAIEGLDIEAVLTSGMGKRAVMKLNAGGIKVFRLEGETVKDAIGLFEQGKLSELSSEGACQGHGCH